MTLLRVNISKLELCMPQILSLMSNRCVVRFFASGQLCSANGVGLQRRQIWKLIFKAILVLLDALEDVCKCNFSLRGGDGKSPHGFILFYFIFRVEHISASNFWSGKFQLILSYHCGSKCLSRFRLKWCLPFFGLQLNLMVALSLLQCTVFCILCIVCWRIFSFVCYVHSLSAGDLLSLLDLHLKGFGVNVECSGALYVGRMFLLILTLYLALFCAWAYIYFSIRIHIDSTWK